MKEIQDLHVTQIRIFPADTIPYETFSVSEKLKQFKDVFHFSNTQIPFPLSGPGPKVILFESGEFDLKKRNIILNRLNLEDRRLVLEITGSSDEADAIFEIIASYVNSISNKVRLNEKNCLIKTQETSCLAFLELDFWDIFSSEMKKFVKNELSQFIKLPALSINPKNFSFGVTFRTDDSLQEEGITISPKEITIQPRAGIPFKKRIFFTQSPFDSDAHLKMIQTFENCFTSKMKAGGAVRKKAPEK